MNKNRFSGRACIAIMILLVMDLSGFFIALELLSQRNFDLLSWMVPVFLWVAPILGIMLTGAIRKRTNRE